MLNRLTREDHRIDLVETIIKAPVDFIPTEETTIVIGLMVVIFTTPVVVEVAPKIMADNMVARMIGEVADTIKVANKTFPEEVAAAAVGVASRKETNNDMEVMVVVSITSDSNTKLMVDTRIHISR